MDLYYSYTDLLKRMLLLLVYDIYNLLLSKVSLIYRNTINYGTINNNKTLIDIKTDIIASIMNRFLWLRSMIYHRIQT